MIGRRSKAKSVLIIVENLPIPQDKRVWQEARSLVDAGYEVAVICPKGQTSKKSFEVLDGVSIYRHWLPLEAKGALGFVLEYTWAFACEFLLTWKVYFRHRFAAIHACNPPDTIFLIAVLFRVLFGTRFLFDHHDGNPELWIAKGGREHGAVHRALCFVEKWTFRAAEVSLAVNDHYVGIATGRGRMPADSVFLVRNSPGSEIVEGTLRKLAELDRQSDGPCIVGYLGVIGAQDGVDNLMHVIDHIVHQLRREDVRFLIMGDGPELLSVRELARKLGIDSHVEFTGWISGDEYIDNLASCDMCVNADPVNGYNMHCSPNKVYEYMLFGVPIVQFDMPESRIVAGDAALYAKPHDNSDFAEKVLALVDDPERRATMGKIGHDRFLQHFTWTNSEKELIRAYDRLFSDA